MKIFKFNREKKEPIEPIEKIGIKAYSLSLLKNLGLFEDNLYISSVLPSKDRFFEGLRKAGFNDRDEMSARFSHPSKSVHLPRKICSNFNDAYEFYQNNFKESYTILVHDLLHAKYAGTISLIDNELVMEFIEGDWNADYSINIDTAIFKNGVSTWYLYKGKRTVPYVNEGKIMYKEIESVDEKTAEKMFKNMANKIPLFYKVLSLGFNSLELLIDNNAKFKVLKLHNIKSSIKNLMALSDGSIFELKTPHDIKRWDKKQQLLISIPATVDRADALMKVITEIKKYTDSVYISYGILSHPAILLREFGFKVERKISNYRVLKFKY
ncbi:hypothetical protein A3D00_00915 [Candidatus Woesebacteria bacterium RIFCSPHIGHO2_02_FULL_38_9]|uniref:Uncharacterized protein n=1 Tax=Candidatus Woesebacteria bacterium RIFCSPHIGHO2_01_FULL_39_28 TaxID=1802496 RepID=A0A1F7YF23_9BACT|nr:MAG: hypothetical protein A2627_02245 [Candidatus Woesebacteria bacterium RIFCSPHIGHO2_01_FULL_39_28]OGM31418.1 MAG: hypothetical protein A3D00_00915 [Candidatus Woesebacteria bacterium RIFCSPHIGHO2_02_FULL_38_9]OGM58156.1 MAG: hypothetical protein A3A50_00125 [Candidatus Woesebacteria bacterium RIFCSPLOWO2_01_FULL_38_20]